MDKLLDIVSMEEVGNDIVFTLLKKELGSIKDGIDKGIVKNTKDIFKHNRIKENVSNIENALSDRFGIHVQLKPGEKNEFVSVIDVPGMNVEIEDFSNDFKSIKKYIMSKEDNSEKIEKIRNSISRKGIIVKDNKIIGVNKQNSIVVYLDLYEFFHELGLTVDNVTHLLISAVEQAINELLAIYHEVVMMSEFISGMKKAKNKKDIKEVAKKNGFSISSNLSFMMPLEFLKSYKDAKDSLVYDKINLIGEGNYLSFEGISDANGRWASDTAARASTIFTLILALALFFTHPVLLIYYLPSLVITWFIYYVIYFIIFYLFAIIFDIKDDEEEYKSPKEEERSEERIVIIIRNDEDKAEVEKMLKGKNTNEALSFIGNKITSIGVK